MTETQVPLSQGLQSRQRKQETKGVFVGAMIEFCTCEGDAPGPHLTKSFV